MKNTLVSLVIAGVMAIGFTGCGSEDDSSSNSNSTITDIDGNCLIN